ncbi:hypothetical protein JCM14469_27080 [Desulfatiferula olefinivorans]
MDTASPIDHLAGTIRTAIDRPWLIDAATGHFLDSSFSIRDGQSLLRLSEASFDDDRETLIDLMLSPDPALLTNLEPLLLGRVFSENDEKALARMIGTPELTARIAFPEKPECLICPVGAEALDRFVKKIRITVSFPEPMVEALAAALPEPLRSMAASLLRQSGLTFHPEAVSFFSMYFPVAAREPDALTDELTLILGTLSDRKREDIRSRLIERHDDCLKRLDELRFVDEMLKKNTMEVLMLQGVRVPSISQETIEARITVLRRLLSAIYGWTGEAEPAVTHRDLGRCTGENGILKIIDLLS